MFPITYAAMPKKGTSVQVTLRSTNYNQAQPSDPLGPYRYIVLDEQRPSVILGRASNNKTKGYVAARDNGYYSNAVMSREHAEIMVDLDNKTVSIRDMGSLHGTAFIKKKRANGYVVADMKLEPGEIYELSDGDELRLGASIFRSNICFEPNNVNVGINWSGQFPTTFQVPDESDDGSSDMEDNVIDLTTQPSRTGGRVVSNTVATRDVIDLSSSPPPFSSSPPPFSSSPPPSGRLDIEAEEELPSVRPKSRRESFDFEELDELDRTSEMDRPQHSSDTIGRDLVEDFMNEDDDGSTDLDASSTRDSNESDQDQDDDDDELMREESSEDGEINEGDSSMSDSQDEDDQTDFWGIRPDDRSAFPQAAYMAKRASSVYALCNPPSFAESNLTEFNAHTHHYSHIFPQSNLAEVNAHTQHHPYLNSRVVPDLSIFSTSILGHGKMMQGPGIGQAREFPEPRPSKRTNLGIPDLLYADKAPEKRKADGISTLSPEEQRWAAEDMKENRKVIAPLSPATSGPLLASDPTHPSESKDAESSNVESNKAENSKAENKAVSTEKKATEGTTTTLVVVAETVEMDHDHVQTSQVLPKATSVPSPIEVNSVPSPVEANSVPSPVEVNSVPSPSEVNSVPSPVEETSVPSPVEVTSVPSPVDVNSYPSPIEAAETEPERPAKRQRVRDIAERVGYAALGGVTAGAMIVGTLIYTAPTFA